MGCKHRGHTCPGTRDIRLGGGASYKCEKSVTGERSVHTRITRV